MEAGVRVKRGLLNGSISPILAGKHPEQGNPQREQG